MGYCTRYDGEIKDKRTNGEIQYNINLLLGMPNKVFDFGLRKDELLYLEELIKALSLKEEEATKQAEKRFIEIIDEVFFKEKFNIYCGFSEWLKKDIEELKQKLTNHTPKEQTKPDRVKSDKGRSNAVILQNETPIRRDKSVSAETIKTQEKRNE